MAKLVKVCTESDLPSGGKISVGVSNESILVVHSGDKFYAVSNLCTHEKVELVNGFLVDEEIVCLAHLSRFKLETGAVSNPPATFPLKTYRTVLESGEIYVEVGPD
jgi:3-phenylpropionate/trans-cinnamate dioxygenase ferredoxin subunit